jgi:hypothetical protein
MRFAGIFNVNLAISWNISKMKGMIMKTGRKRSHRYFSLAGVVLAAVLALTGCAAQKVLVKAANPEKMIHFSDLKGWDENKNLNGYVVYVDKGETIPLKISMESDFMDFKQHRIDLVAKQKLYFMIKMPENLTAAQMARLKQFSLQDFLKMNRQERSAFLKDYMLFVSKDAEHWAPLYGGRAYHEVLGFKKGLISFGMMAGTTDGLEANLNIRTVK